MRWTEPRGEQGLSGSPVTHATTYRIVMIQSNPRTGGWLYSTTTWSLRSSSTCAGMHVPLVTRRSSRPVPVPDLILGKQKETSRKFKACARVDFLGYIILYIIETKRRRDEATPVGFLYSSRGVTNEGKFSEVLGAWFAASQKVVIRVHQSPGPGPGPAYSSRPFWEDARFLSFSISLYSVSFYTVDALLSVVSNPLRFVLINRLLIFSL